ncbi:MAG TPA: aminotransferase class III-fold pyridoxal phosphate-dependent enzyme [Methylococcales bacterium]
MQAYAGHIVDINNVDYIDMVSSWGSNILGYGNKRVAEAVSAQILKYSNTGMIGPEWRRLHEILVRLVPCAEAIHVLKNGSDATAAAIRLARFVTAREKVLHRGYHGAQDWFMASIHCPGVPSTHYEQIISITTLDVEQVRQIFAAHPGQIACLIIDPMLWPIPDRETMLSIRDIVHKEGALLIYDEVVSGFRVAVGGAQQVWDVLPDLACYGKCIANGLPLSVMVGSEQWMRHEPSINYGLTFGLEAVSIVAAIETINEIVDRKVCSDLAKKGQILKKAYSDMCTARGIESALVGHDCRPELYFQEANELSPEYCKNLIIHELSQHQVFTYGIFNLCYAHTHNDIEAVISALGHGLDKVQMAVWQTTKLEKQTLIQLQGVISNLRDQFSQSQAKLSKSKEEVNQYNAELSRAREEVEAMKSSKFWKIRSLWFSIKQKFGLGV